MKDSQGNLAPKEKVYLYDDVKKEYIKIQEIMENKWDEIFKERVPKKDEEFETERDRYHLFDGKNLWPVYLKFNLISQTIFYYGNLPLSSCQGLFDIERRELLTNEYITKPLIFKEVIRNWPSVKQREELPFSPNHIFFMRKFFEPRKTPCPDGAVIQMIKQDNKNLILKEKFQGI